MKRPVFLLACAALMGAPSFVHAATFNVTTAAELQTALNTAASNGEDDVINLADGTYTTTGSPFTYSASMGENFSITVSGSSPSAAILNGANNNVVLRFDMSGISPKTQSNAIVQDLSIEDGVGGLYFLQPSTFNVSRVILSGNTGALSGGAIFASIFDGTSLIVDCLFSGNSALQGSAIYILDTQATLNLVNNTLTNNDSPSPFLSPPVYISTDQDTAIVNLYNNIAYNNHVGTDFYISDNGDANANGSPVNLLNNLYEAFSTYCTANPGTCTPDVTQSANLAGENPLFVSATDFQLQSTSPAIDAGLASAPSLPDTDLLGNPRSISGSVDMGAYQAIPTLSASLASDSFGEVAVDSSSSILLTLSNTGNHSLAVSSISLSDTVNFSLGTSAGSSPCSSATPTIPAGGSCTVGIAFNPSEAGEQDCTITIASDDPNTPSASLILSGAGTSSGGGEGASSGGCSLGQSSSTACMPFLFLLILLLQRVHAALHNKFRF